MGALQAFDRSLDIFYDTIDSTLKATVVRETNRIARETSLASLPNPTYRFNIGGRFVEKPFIGLNDVANSNGEVIILFDHRREVASNTLMALKKMAPTVSGEYANSFMLFVDGREADLSQIRAGRAVEIINIAPYARKLEVGRSQDGSPFIVQGPYGLMERGVGKSIRGRFLKLADVRFAYLDIDNPYILTGKAAGSKYVSSYGVERTRQAFADRKAGQPVRYPTLVLGERRYDI